jgi:hypothetical protein
MALPQSGGGVRIKVRGNDRKAVRDHQAAWLEWSETLPKRETKRYCSNCGHELREDAQFCSNCGRHVHQTARVPTPEAEVPVPPPPPQQQEAASAQPLEQAIRKMHGHFIAPREVPISVSYEQAIEELDQFFALDFQTNRDCTLRYFDDGIQAIERTQSSPLLLVIHLALTLFTFGFSLIVWFVVAARRVSNRQKVRMRLIQEEDKITAELSGSNSWVQITEAFIRRNLKGER